MCNPTEVLSNGRETVARLSESDRERLALFITEMIKQREHKGWSQAELASHAHVSKSLVAQVETYQRAPSETLAGALDTAYGLPGTFARLYVAARGNGPWPAAFGEFAIYEPQAVSLLVFEHAYVPGLLQTSEYAHATLSHHHSATADQVAERVKARLSRQAVLSREDPAPPVLWVVIDEMVLHREIGGPQVMASQLDHVAAVAQRPGVSIAIVPRSTGAHPGLAGMFHIAELSDGTAILYAEDIADGRITDDAAMVAETMQRWRYVQSCAMSVDSSLDRIREMAQQWKTTASQVDGGKLATAAPTDHALKPRP